MSKKSKKIDKKFEKIKEGELKSLKEKISKLENGLKKAKLIEQEKIEKDNFLKLSHKVDILQNKPLKYLKSYEIAVKNIKSSFEKITLRKKENKKRNMKLSGILFYLIFAITIISLILWGFSKFVPEIANIFIKFFGSYQMYVLVSWGFFFLFVAIILVQLLVIAGRLDNKPNKFPWVFSTLIIMLCFFLISIIYTQISIGQEDLHLLLRDSSDNNKVLGEIDCSGGSKSFLLIKENIFCNVKPKLENETIYVEFTYENKTSSLPNRLLNNSFISPENVTYLFFEVTGLNNNEIFSANIGYPYSFLTEAEALQKKKEFIRYLGIIFAIIFVSIPLIMNKFKELSED